jgi:transmembrane sensor
VNSEEKPARKDIMETASLWFARLDSETADIDAFEAWRDADPSHAAAFARIAGVGFQLDRLKRLQPAPAAKSTENPVNRRNLLMTAGGGLVLAAAGATAVSVATARASASTAVGGRQTVALPDGGQISLNTDSKASWKFDNDRRRIWLERGEIALLLPHDPRPCFLYGGESEVRVGEGDLNVRLRGQALDLTVVKGACTVSASARHNASGDASATVPLTVKAGEAVLAQTSNLHVRSLDAQDLQFISGWRSGELVFTGQTLGVAVAEYNRYLPRKMVILDAGLENIRLGGRFTARDPSDFLASLQSGFGIHVTRDASGATMLSR